MITHTCENASRIKSRAMSLFGKISCHDICAQGETESQEWGVGI